MEKEGFKITRNLAGMKDAFIAEYGQGSPVIGILAEYHALTNMSQESDVARLVAPLTFPNKPMSGSTEVGDVSWTLSTVTAVVTTAPNGTPAHSWQRGATGKSSIAHKGMITAGKTIAMTALNLLENPEIVMKAKEKHERNLGGKPYESAIPPQVSPR